MFLVKEKFVNPIGMNYRLYRCLPLTFNMINLNENPHKHLFLFALVTFNASLIICSLVL